MQTVKEVEKQTQRVNEKNRPENGGSKGEQDGRADEGTDHTGEEDEGCGCGSA